MANMTLRILPALLTLVAAPLLCSCSSDKDEEKAGETAKSFAENYFGCRYAKAAELCTPESRRWIEFVATNVGDSDLYVLNNSAEEAAFEVKDMTVGDDSTATCTIEADNYLRLSSIEDKGRIASSDNYKLRLVHKNGKWLVALDCVLKPDDTKEE